MKHLLVIFSAVILLASCRTQKHVTKQARTVDSTAVVKTDSGRVVKEHSNEETSETEKAVEEIEIWFDTDSANVPGTKPGIQIDSTGTVKVTGVTKVRVKREIDKTTDIRIEKQRQDSSGVSVETETSVKSKHSEKTRDVDRHPSFGGMLIGLAACAAILWVIIILLRSLKKNSQL